MIQAAVRFESRYIPEPNSGCWLYDRPYSGDYPQFMVHGKGYRFHQAAYIIYKGPIPKGKVVRHSCDVKCCGNPYHLVLGTQNDNIQDCISRNRAVYVRGEKMGNAVLNEAIIRLMRMRYDAGGSKTAIGAEFGVTSSYVGRILRGEIWKDAA